MNTATELDDNQQMLADSAIKYLERGYSDAVRAASTAHVHGCDPARWSEFAEFGWLALAIPEQDGGLGGSLVEVCVLAEQLGRGLVVEPVIAGGFLPGLLLARLPASELRDSWLARIGSGAQRLAFAPWEPQARHNTAAITTSAEFAGGGWVVHGSKGLAPGAAGADVFVVCARTGMGTLGLLLVDARATGLTIEARALYDDRHAASLKLAGVTGAHLLCEGTDAEMLQRINGVMDHVTIAHCAEVTGTMAQALEITREYLTTRKQFGKTIASNQVIQHRLVDPYVEIEESRSLVRAAAMSPTPRMAAAAAAYIAHAARHVWEESIQLHGAIGITEEYTIGRYVRRLALAASLYGDTHHHLERLAVQSLGDIE
jgi:alkylation response protein AidB-like acyl-CoA dehydrogenase